ncbi:MAG: Hydratase/decarboxylase [Ramlibacter sp.]|nr:Hydratase/decarboxylase [Ramlibacter sp.]
MDPFAQRLLQARQGGVPAAWREGVPADARQAYAVQDATLAALSATGGWKVDASAPDAEPTCAPLPAAGLRADGARLHGAGWGLRGIEVEVALRLGLDLDGSAGPPPLEVLQSAVAAVQPAIEVVETRLQDWRASPPLAQLADLQSHGALVLGAAATLPPAELDLRQLVAYLAFDGQPVASARGAHPVGDPWRLLAWLAVHCSRRGQPLRAGQVVTTGSCTGLLFAPEGARVEAQLHGIGRVGLQF